MPANMKMTIAATFLEMVKRKGIDKITVKEIIDECRISRQTFYYHFQDIMEVIEWTVEQSIRQMLERSLEAKNLREALDILITCTRENRVLIRRLLDSQKREEIEKLLICELLAFCCGCPAVASGRDGNFYGADPQCWKEVEA